MLQNYYNSAKYSNLACSTAHMMQFLFINFFSSFYIFFPWEENTLLG